MFQRSNHDQHDIMDHDHDHETPTGFIKIDNQIIFTQEFGKKIIQIYENMVNVLYAFRAKIRTNYDWYPTKNMKFDYAFSCFKNVARIQMLPKMNEKNVLKFYSVEKLLRFLYVNFGDQNKIKTAPNKIRSLKMEKKPFAEYLAEFQQHIKNTGFDIDNQKYFFLTGCSWKLQKLLV